MLLHHLTLTDHCRLLLLLLLGKQVRVILHLLLKLLLMLLLLLHHIRLRIQVTHGHGIRTGAAHILPWHSHPRSRALRTHTARHAAYAGLHSHHSASLCHMWISSS